MTMTTEYGTWQEHGDGELTVEDNIAAALGEFAHEYDVPAIVAAYRKAINDALPPGVTLDGDLFYGPYPFSADRAAQVRAAVASVDFWPIVAEADRSNTVT